MHKRESHDYRKYYQILERIGTGSFTIVYKGKEIKTNKLRAIKVILLDKLKETISLLEKEEALEKKLKEYINGYINECENMKICSDINSVKYYEYFNDGNNFVIIMELCDCNLLQLLLKKNKEGFNVKEIYEIMTQLNNEFKVLKKNKIIHRDLKLENILIKCVDKDNNKYIIKLADYGSSRRLNSLSKNYCNTNVGTLIYMAPEILKGNKYNYKCDLWSIGIIIYILKFDKSPFNGQTEIALINNINIFNNNLIKKTGNKELDDLIKNLLEKDYEKRLNWDDYFNHPFFHPFSSSINQIYDKSKIKYYKMKFNWNDIDNDHSPNKINLKYYKTKEKDKWDKDNNIFGEKFVKNNINNVELKINGIKSKLMQNYKLKYGENNIEIIIKNKITNFENMFSDCISLINIEGLENLNVSNGNNFSNMFWGCYSLSDINPLKNWNVSNGNNFSYMFWGCYSLSDINPLKNWNVSNGNNFSYMFYECESLSNIRPLEYWDVSNGNNFSNMFCGCYSLSDINPLENWNVSNGNNFSYFFSRCEFLSDINPLKNWNVSNGYDFSWMFWGCYSLLDINPLENWSISNGYDFSGMFYRCLGLSNIEGLKMWDISNGKNFSKMFSRCESLTNIKSLKNWNVSKGNNFSDMFYRCLSLLSLEGLENWDVSNGNNFSYMFCRCLSLSSLEGLENWDVSIGNNFSYMFCECESLSNIRPLEYWDVSKGNDFLFMFNECKLLSNIKPLEK